MKTSPGRTGAGLVAALGGLLEVAAAVAAGLGGDVAGAVAALPYAAFSVVGFVIVGAQPRNTVGRVFLVSGVLFGLTDLGSTGSRTGRALGWPDPLVHLLAWTNDWSWFPALFLVITIGLLHFPDGRPVSRWWRWVDGASIAVMAVFAVAIAVVTWALPTAELLSDAAPSATGWRGGLLAVAFACIPAIVPCVLAAVVSAVVRWRRSSGVARLQIRWVAAAGLVATTVEIVDDGLGTIGAPIPDAVQTLSESFGFSLVAVAAGFAITRHRLYDIDRIVSRTVGYTVVTALLLGVYLGLAALAGIVIPRTYGSVGVAAATLAVAALFVPLRRRVQRAVDRRFDRSRYDAVRTVEAFAERLRTDLSGHDLHAELLATVRAAVAPTAAGVWLAPGRDAR